MILSTSWVGLEEYAEWLNALYAIYGYAI